MGELGAVSKKTKKRAGMHVLIMDMLKAGPMTPTQVVEKTAWPLHAVASSMRAMADPKRRELVRLKCKPGQWARYRLRAEA